MQEAPGEKATYGQVFADHRFRVLFAARALGVTADALRSVALSILVFNRTDSPLLAAVAFSIGFLPQAIGGTFLGALVDRFPPRELIATGYLAQCLTGMALAYAHLPVTVGLILVGAVACATPVFTGASSLFVAEALHGDAYVLGRSLFYLVAVGAQLAGLAGGGVVTAVLGAEHTMAATAVLHLAAALTTRLCLPRQARPERNKPEAVVRASWQRNRQLLGIPAVRKLLLVQCIPSGFAAAAESLLIPYCAERQFTSTQAGFLLACLPAGMLVGDLAVGRLLEPAARERLVLALLLTLALPSVLLTLPVPYPVVVVVFIVTGSGFAYLLGIQRAFLAAVPEQLRGQSFALLNTGTMTTQGAAPALFGGIAEFLPVAVAVSLTGVASLATTLSLRRTVTHDWGKPTKSVTETS
ncbi:MFS transporter [Amycolatopsis rubida]|uniref:MFS transporter n=1 Tax=Amycolatopsis rubida TaxID=112413 RepID=A0ABX0C570_9PSEU|nr:MULTISPECIES: MFS transporter [Amycolatopsis]MYW97932.1 MFS transporter [Amycolatopsis rubida]NEC62917.1 MFS transporter [Amycolatopsis rubida]OAP24940.1 enterobactin exporter EntS [Amycolatopsis sp. M39]